MNEDIPDNFWKEWEMATDKKKKLEELPLKTYIKEGKEMNFYSLLNSYFEDLFRYKR